jgi:glucokinase
MASTSTETMAMTTTTNTTTSTCSTYLLIGDIGGTNSRMRLYDTSNPTPLVEVDYGTQDVFKDGESTEGAFERLIIDPFLKYCWGKLNVIDSNQIEIISVFAVAGPVDGNKATLTNVKITIDGDAIERNLYCQYDNLRKIKRSLIINDFIAQGYGCLSLDPSEIVELTKDSLKMIDPNGPKVCVGAGTGLGECFLTPTENGYYCFPSEGGHVEFNPRSNLEIRLRTYLMFKYNCAHRVSVERVVSGTGLVNVYEFLAIIYPDLVDETIHTKFLSAGDMKGKVVAENASNNEICKIAMDIMIRYVSYLSEPTLVALAR